MATVRVTALKDFQYGGQPVRKGELVSMRVVDASIAARRQEVSLDRGLNTRTMQAEREPEPEKPRRRYRRRDMRAEE